MKSEHLKTCVEGVVALYKNDIIDFIFVLWYSSLDTVINRR